MADRASRHPFRPLACVFSKEDPALGDSLSGLSARPDDIKVVYRSPGGPSCTGSQGLAEPERMPPISRRRCRRHHCTPTVPRENGGGRRIRTFEDLRRQIYSLMRLATSLSHRERGVILYWDARFCPLRSEGNSLPVNGTFQGASFRSPELRSTGMARARPSPDWQRSRNLRGGRFSRLESRLQAVLEMLPPKGGTPSERFGDPPSGGLPLLPPKGGTPNGPFN